MVLKVLDNFVFGIAGLRLHHRIQELTPDGQTPARGSDPMLAVTTAMAISPRNAHQYCTLARPLSKRRDGHHKKTLLTTAQQEGKITTHVSNHRHRARAPRSGHATAAPPSVAKNFRRPM
jgi:hypothetical protein